jgi:hypothetical protein
VKFILMIFFFQRLAVANFVPGFAFTTDDYSNLGKDGKLI